MGAKKFVNVINSNPYQTTAAGASTLRAMEASHKALTESANAQTVRNGMLAGGGTYMIPQSADGAGGKTMYGPHSANGNIQSTIVGSNLATSQTQYDGEVAKPGTLHQSSAGPGPVVGGPSQSGGSGGINAYYGICGPSCPYFGGKPQYSGGRRKKNRKTRRKRRKGRRSRKRRRGGKRSRRAGRRRRHGGKRSKRGGRRTRKGGHGNTKCKEYDVSKLITPSYPIYDY